MSESEVIVMLASMFFTYKFIITWYKPIANNNSLRRNMIVRLVLGILPVISFGIILYTLKELASFDVVSDGNYIMFYLLIGITWMFFGLKLIFYFFDLSWIDDVLGLNNMGALASMIGGFLAITIIYSGANIGDGPGWWTVIIAGGLGLVAWIVLALLIHRFTKVFERITVERDIACGIRFGFYLLASGLILGRASAGDWTSFSHTLVEFLVGWPALAVTILELLVEVYICKKTNDKKSKYNEFNDKKANYNEFNIKKHSVRNSIIISLLCGFLYLIIAIVSLSLYPLPQNMIYDNEIIGMIGGVI